MVYWLIFVSAGLAGSWWLLSRLAQACDALVEVQRQQDRELRGLRESLGRLSEGLGDGTLVFARPEKSRSERGRVPPERSW